MNRDPPGREHVGSAIGKPPTRTKSEFAILSFQILLLLSLLLFNTSSNYVSLISTLTLWQLPSDQQCKSYNRMLKKTPSLRRTILEKKQCFQFVQILKDKKKKRK
eukprot:TRINITY_DN124677_c0_g1_i1.p2 TRINITY_DN124677_c0_g1~~TRINITY_DN124677_c0_g1_i1.p2  ORF type:complete len:105 (-),score=10.77 TRINITY_DN124677_c0_g1_i1:179-493(-)